jgi:hypothetical protein
VGHVAEGEVQLALVDPLVEPGAAEDEAAQPVDQRALGRADDLGPAVVDVIAERRGGIEDLPVDSEVHEILQLRVVQAFVDEAKTQRGLLAALAEVRLVEREAQFSVLEHEVLARVVISTTRGIHRRALPWGRRHHKLLSCTGDRAACFLSGQG